MTSLGEVCMEQHVECLRRTEGRSQRQPHLDLGSRQEEDGMGKMRGDAKRAEWKEVADLEDPTLRGMG